MGRGISGKVCWYEGRVSVALTGMGCGATLPANLGDGRGCMMESRGRSVEWQGIAFKQEGVQMFTGAVRAEDLLQCTEIDIFRREDGSESGYQRAPERSRARALARFLKTQNIALLPNSVLLNARDEVEIVEEGGLARLRIPDSVKLWVVDGQHRLAGLRVAIEEEEDLRFKDYLIPVVVTVGLDEAKEAEQFRVINETAKKVRTDLARRILALSMSTRAGRNQLREQQRMWEATASQVIDLLNSDENSPFHRRIQQPNEKKSARHTVRELSFSSSLKPILNTFPYQDWGSQKVADQLRDYWEAWYMAVPECFDHAEDYVLLRTPGIFSLHEVALFAWEVCRRENTEPTASRVGDMLSDIPDYTSPRFWESENIEGAAVFGSMKGFRMLADMIKGDLIENGYVTE